MLIRVMLMFSIVLVCASRNDALPRDSSVVKTDNIRISGDEVDMPERKLIQHTLSNEPSIPGRQWCQHEGAEPAEDDICQGHCIPKGYSYGLCISNTCSCI